MKKTLLSVAALCMLSASADAQFYYRLGFGYAMPLAGQSIVGSELPYSGSLNYGSLNYNIKSASFSAGLQGYVGLGYQINNNIGIQLDAQAAGFGSKKFDLNIQNISVNSVPSSVTVSQRAKFPLNLVPSMVVQTGGDPWNIYCRMGVALPLSSTIEKQNIIVNAAGTGALTQKVETWEIHSHFSPGLAAAAGFEYRMGSNTAFWAEVSMLSMSLYIKDAELTAFSYNGQNLNLGQLRGTMHINYSKNIQLDTANGTAMPAYTQPFSNVGINVGIRHTFGGGGSGGRTKNREEMENRRRTGF